MRMVLFVTFLGSLMMVQAQDKQIKRVPITPTPANSGQTMFNSYCAVCHGTDAKGDGPAASALKKTPADLTQLAAKNGGKYPENHVMAVIRAADSPVHGSKEMPIWGNLFWSMSGGHEGEVQQRVANLNKYLESLQK